MSETSRRKMPMIVVSFALSLMLWMLVQLQNRPDTLPENYSVDLEIRNLDPGLGVIEKPQRVGVRALGVVEAVEQINPAEITAYVDLTGARPGLGRYPIVIKAPARYRAQFSAIRPLAEIRIERMIRKEVPVQVETQGQLPATNLLFSDVVTEPEEVTVEGPESQVNRVSKVRALLDLSRVTPGSSYSVTVEPLESNNRPLSMVRADPGSVTVRPGLVPAPESKSLLLTLQFSGQPAFGFEVEKVEIEPNQLMVRGMSQQLASLSTLKLEPVELSGLRQTSSFQARPILPDGITLAGKTTVRVIVHMRPVPGVPPSSEESVPPGN